MLSRSSAETRQLELLSDLSSLKLRYTALEKENLDMRGQLKRSEQDMITLVSQVQCKLPNSNFSLKAIIKTSCCLILPSAIRCAVLPSDLV